jgi:hypothetical protein
VVSRQLGFDDRRLMKKWTDNGARRAFTNAADPDRTNSPGPDLTTIIHKM